MGYILVYNIYIYIYQDYSMNVCKDVVKRKRAYGPRFTQYEILVSLSTMCCVGNIILQILSINQYHKATASHLNYI